MHKLFSLLKLKMPSVRLLLDAHQQRSAHHGVITFDDLICSLCRLVDLHTESMLQCASYAAVGAEQEILQRALAHERRMQQERQEKRDRINRERVRLEQEMLAREAAAREERLWKGAGSVGARLLTESTGCARGGVPTLWGLSLLALARRHGPPYAAPPIESFEAATISKAIHREWVGRLALDEPTSQIVARPLPPVSASPLATATSLPLLQLVPSCSSPPSASAPPACSSPLASAWLSSRGGLGCESLDSEQAGEVADVDMLEVDVEDDAEAEAAEELSAQPAETTRVHEAATDHIARASAEGLRTHVLRLVGWRNELHARREAAEAKEAADREEKRRARKEAMARREQAMREKAKREADRWAQLVEAANQLPRPPFASSGCDADAGPSSAALSAAAPSTIAEAADPRYSLSKLVLGECTAVCLCLDALIDRVEKWHGASLKVPRSAWGLSAEREAEIIEKVVSSMVDKVVRLADPRHVEPPPAYYAECVRSLGQYLASCGGQQGMVDGWWAKIETRLTGNSAGTTDLYYYGPFRGDPSRPKKFRSAKEVAAHFGLNPNAGIKHCIRKWLPPERLIEAHVTPAVSAIRQPLCEAEISGLAAKYGTIPIPPLVTLAWRPQERHLAVVATSAVPTAVALVSPEPANQQASLKWHIAVVPPNATAGLSSAPSTDAVSAPAVEPLPASRPAVVELADSSSAVSMMAAPADSGADAQSATATPVALPGLSVGRADVIEESKATTLSLQAQESHAPAESAGEIVTMPPPVPVAPPVVAAASSTVASSMEPATGLVIEAEGMPLHLSARSSTGYKGVSRHSGPNLAKPFVAQIMRGGRNVHLGIFATAVEAAVAYAKCVAEAEAGTWDPPPRVALPDPSPPAAAMSEAEVNQRLWEGAAGQGWRGTQLGRCLVTPDGTAILSYGARTGGAERTYRTKASQLDEAIEHYHSAILPVLLDEWIDVWWPLDEEWYPCRVTAVVDEPPPQQEPPVVMATAGRAGTPASDRLAASEGSIGVPLPQNPQPPPQLPPQLPPRPPPTMRHHVHYADGVRELLNLTIEVAPAGLGGAAARCAEVWRPCTSVPTAHTSVEAQRLSDKRNRVGAFAQTAGRAVGWKRAAPPVGSTLAKRPALDCSRSPLAGVPSVRLRLRYPVGAPPPSAAARALLVAHHDWASSSDAAVLQAPTGTGLATSSAALTSATSPSALVTASASASLQLVTSSELMLTRHSCLQLLTTLPADAQLGAFEQLRAIEGRFTTGGFESSAEFVEAVRRVWARARQEHAPTSAVHQAALRLALHFEQRLQAALAKAEGVAKGGGETAAQMGAQEAEVKVDGDEDGDEDGEVDGDEDGEVDNDEDGDEEEDDEMEVEEVDSDEVVEVVEIYEGDEGGHPTPEPAVNAATIVAPGAAGQAEAEEAPDEEQDNEYGWHDLNSDEEELHAADSGEESSDGVEDEID